MMQWLTGHWKLALDPDNVGRRDKWFERIRPEAQDAPVPGIVQQVFPGRFGVAWYWTTFRPARAAAPHERCLLAFEAVDYLAEVWLNGRPLGGHEGGSTPFALDATAALQPAGDNLLVVRVLIPTDEPLDGVTLTTSANKHRRMQGYVPGFPNNWGGILGRVELRLVPAVRLDDVFVRPNVATGRLRVAITVRNDTPAAARGELALHAAPTGGGEAVAVVRTAGAFVPGESLHALDLTVPEPHGWSLEDPYLYRVTARLAADGGFAHEQVVRCGFRDFRVERGWFRLNGRRIFLRSTHTGNHVPMAWVVPQDPDLVRRDLIMAKAAGYNAVRFIAGSAWPEQLDFCDELGLMVYSEHDASWGLEDSPDMARRFDLALREVIRRDRNHPCLTIWGLLNETQDGPIFRHAVQALQLVRSLDDTRLVLLNSGRFDRQLQIGSLSNPGRADWEHQWGAEAPEAPPPQADIRGLYGAHVVGAGDTHLYPLLPHRAEAVRTLRELGRGANPVFLSEYGVGSLLNVIRNLRRLEQAGARPDLMDGTLFRAIAEPLAADWKRWGFDGTYPFAEDMLLDSERLHVCQRRFGFDVIRSNPRLCGYNLTGMLDHGFTGEGAWTFWREWKPGIADALCDGFAPLRWCLFAEPRHGYAGRPVALEVVLANEDVLPPGVYPVRLRVAGPAGIAWEKKVRLKLPAPEPGEDGPLAVSVFRGKVVLNGPPGDYVFAAEMERGGAPAGGRLTFRLAGPLSVAKPKAAIRLWGVAPAVAAWLRRQGVRCAAFESVPSGRPEVILVGDEPELGWAADGWRALACRMARGSCAVFASPLGLRRLPPRPKGGRIEPVGLIPVVEREFAVPNAPQAEWGVFAAEFYGPVHFVVSGLPAGEYVMELGMCEGFAPTPGGRVFDVTINGATVLKDFEILQAAGGFRRAVTRPFRARTRRGQIEIRGVNTGRGDPSVSRIRIRDLGGDLLLEYAVQQHAGRVLPWLPLANKGQCVNFVDWVYHKECVAKAHPVFEGLQAKGVMDWDHYGPVISSRVFEGLATPDEVIAAAFATSSDRGAYAAGLMLFACRFGAGGFLVNTFHVLEHIDRHPAADRLLLNMLRYAAGRRPGRAARLPADFDTVLQSLGYSG